jgi:hypothetical protein
MTSAQEREAILDKIREAQRVQGLLGQVRNDIVLGPASVPLAFAMLLLRVLVRAVVVVVLRNRGFVGLLQRRRRPG